MWSPGGFYLKSLEAFLLLQSKCDDWYYRSENSTFEYTLSMKEVEAFSKARINKLQSGINRKSQIQIFNK